MAEALVLRRSGGRALGDVRLARPGCRVLGCASLVSTGVGGGGAPAAVGGAALLTDEANGFAADFTWATDAQRVAVKASSVVTEYAVDSFFANAGTSPKQVFDVAGTLVWSPHNMYIQSATPATRSVTTITGATYTVTVTGTGSLTGSSGASGVAAAGAPLTYTATGTTSTFTLAGSLTTVQMNRGSVATAYLPTTTAARYGLALDYDPATHAAKGLLPEPAATNLLTLSQDISGLTAEGGTATLNDQVGPDGLSTADTFTENTATSNHDCYGSSVVTANVDHTLSRYFKMGTRRYATMGWSDGTNAAYAVYDLQSGVVGSSATIGTGVLNSASIQACSNGWYRCILSGKVNAATMYRTFGAATAATITPDAYGRQSFLGTGATLFMAHAQLETGTVATSPIPTYAASATRAADIYNVTPASINHSATAGSWWIEHAQNVTGASRIVAYVTASAAPLLVSLGTGFQSYDAALGTLTKANASTAGVTYRAGVAFQAGDRALTVAGLAPATDASLAANFFNPGATIYIGCSTTAGSNGYVRKVFYLPRRMSNAELVTKTT